MAVETFLTIPAQGTSSLAHNTSVDGECTTFLPPTWKRKTFWNGKWREHVVSQEMVGLIKEEVLSVRGTLDRILQLEKNSKVIPPWNGWQVPSPSLVPSPEH